MPQHKPEFVIACHRLPLKFENGRPVPTDGGLASALRSAGLEEKSLWVGTLGGDIDTAFVEHLPSYCENISISTKHFDEFYNGYSNSVLWPAFHDRPDLVNFNEDQWISYSRVNQLFAEKILATTSEDTPVWVHDYQLLLLPYYIKQIQPQRQVSFFLHIPWPELRVAERVPHIAELVYSLSRCDGVGFHTAEYIQNLEDFRRALAHDLGRDVPEINCKVLPIGIKPENFQTEESSEKFLWNGKNVKWTGTNIIGVDRLDYSKGLLQKIEVFGDFLELNPEWRGKVTLRQLLIPTREDIKTYAQYKKEVLGLAEYVNNNYATENWKPIDLFYGRTDQDNLKKIYNNGDICWVSSYKDGMNLVAMEYVAAQNSKKPGVLLLSNKAGCSHYLDGPVCFDATSSVSIFKALSKSLCMSDLEKKQRHQKALSWINRNTVGHWVDENIELLNSHSTPDKKEYATNFSSVASATALR